MMMKKYLALLLLFLSIRAIAQVEDDVPARPSPPQLVNDFTKTLARDQVDALETKLKHYDDTTSNQVAVVIIDDLKGNGLEDYAIALGRKWGVGNKDFNNGVVLLVVKGSRKVTIQVGYGLEGMITDLTAKAIIDNEIVPNFKTNDYYRGLDEATTAIIQAAAGKYKAPDGWSNRGKKGSGRSIIYAIVFFVILMAIIGGIRGGGGGGYVSRRGYSDWSGGGWIGGGGGWSGGGGGGSSGGGGFGGFGGGSFGGGGASGSW